MTIGNLGLQVPQDEMDAASRRARLAALARLREEAADAASTLGMLVAGYQHIDLTGDAVPRTPLYARPRPMKMAAIAAPIAQNVTQTVAADVFLRVAAAAQSQNH